MTSRISSKDLFDEQVVGGHGKEVLLFVFSVLRLVGGDVGKDVKTNNWGGGDGGAGDDISRIVRDVEEGVIFRVVKDWPGKLRGGGKWDRSNR